MQSPCQCIIISNIIYNVDGSIIRIMVIDSEYKQGINLYDVSYVHILGDLMSISDRIQAVGRSVRYCGQSGIPFTPHQGWKLKVYEYKDKATNGNSVREKVIRYDPSTYQYAEYVGDYINWSMENAIDKVLNKKINSHAPAKYLSESKYSRESSGTKSGTKSESKNS